MQLLTFTHTHTQPRIQAMTTELAPGKYPCKRGGSGVVVGETNKDSVESMLQVYNTASSTRDACNTFRTSECPKDCKLKKLVAQVVDNLNELIK